MLDAHVKHCPMLRILEPWLQLMVILALLTKKIDNKMWVRNCVTSDGGDGHGNKVMGVQNNTLCYKIY